MKPKSPTYSANMAAKEGDVESRCQMKHLLLTTIAAVLVVGCATTQQPEPPTAEAPDISIREAARDANIGAVKQHIAAGTDVNAKEEWGWTPLHFTTTKEIAELLIGNGADVNAKNDGGFTPLHYAASRRDKEIAELLIAKDADVNAKMEDGDTPLDWAIEINRTETAALLRKHGGKKGDELKAEGK